MNERSSMFGIVVCTLCSHAEGYGSISESGRPFLLFVKGWFCNIWIY